MVGRQTPVLALIVPLILVGMVDGMRGVRQTWPVAIVGGVAFAVGQFLCSNYISVELTDIVASLASAGAIVGFLRVWQPSETVFGEAVHGRAATGARRRRDHRRRLRAGGRRRAGEGGGDGERDSAAGCWAPTRRT